MSNKKQRNREPGIGRASIFESRAFTILGGVLFVALFIALGIVIVTALGVGKFGADDPDVPDLPALSAAPEMPRSRNADVLAGTSFEDMTPEQRNQVAADAKALFDDADLRASSDQVPGLDIARRGGHTRATRQYRYSDNNPGKQWSLTTTTIFYCDGPPGTVDLFRVDDAGFEAAATYDRRSADSPPFERIYSGADWSAPVDLGLRDINGIRVRGVQIKYKPQETATAIDVEHWYDVETGRLTFYKDVRVDNELGYFLDWGVPPVIEVPEAMDTDPPCAASVTGD